jgi:predicted Na+-dependent transporter
MTTSHTQTSATTATAGTPRNNAGRSVAVQAGIILGAVIVNIILFFAFTAAGGDFQDAAGTPAGLPNVVLMTLAPLVLGLGLTALLAKRWPKVRTIARWVGAALALLTIAMTAAARFDTPSFVARALMHVVVAAAIVLALAPAKR